MSMISFKCKTEWSAFVSIARQNNGQTFSTFPLYKEKAGRGTYILYDNSKKYDSTYILSL